MSARRLTFVFIVLFITLLNECYAAPREADEVEFMIEKGLRNPPRAEYAKAKKDEGGNVVLDVMLGDQPFTLRLKPASMYKSGYTPEAPGEQPVRIQYTYHVYSDSDEHVRGGATLHGNGDVQDMIVYTQSGIWVFDEIGDGFSMVYRSSDVIETTEYYDEVRYISESVEQQRRAMTARGSVGDNPTTASRVTSRRYTNNNRRAETEEDDFGFTQNQARQIKQRSRRTPVQIAEVVMDFDVEFVDLTGSGTMAIEKAASIINYVNTIYIEQLQIQLVIVDNHVHTSKSEYPSFDMNAALDDMTSFWATPTMSAKHAKADLVYLMSGKSFAGNIIGLAYVGAVCHSSLDLGMGQTLYSSHLLNQVGLTAHEIGHLFGCGHYAGFENIMNSFITGSWIFSQECVSAASAFVARQTCLSVGDADVFVACDNEPCFTGSCIDNGSPLTFTCDCSNTGFTGETCSVDVDECISNPCDNNADCLNTEGSYNCICNAGFSGNGLECTDIDECTQNPCDSNAACVNTAGSYTCTCNAGYSGNGLECTDIDECTQNPCDINAACVNTDGSYSCTCNAGFSGNGLECTDIDECTQNPCDSNAACVNTAGSYTCACNAGYSGNGLECTDIDECTQNPCDINAACVNTAGSYTCTCNAGYTGDGAVCTDINECISSPCKNGGICHNGDNGFTCTCATGYIGSTCATNKNDCRDASKNLCVDANTKQCVDGIDSVTCQCNPGWAGEFCETYICECENGGDCIDNGGVEMCHCVNGFAGNLCDIAPTLQNGVNACIAQKCNNNGNCVNDEGALGFQCNCFEGWKGDTCYESTVNYCADSPCAYGGTCISERNGPKCLCVEGTSGDLCRIEVQECASSPCVAGTCIDRLNKYECKCDSGWSGVNCDNVL
eukprot:CFRG0184T1